jgi:hypothetical protein
VKSFSLRDTSSTASNYSSWRLFRRMMTAAEATWMDRQEFQHLYPQFQLEDELLAKEGRDVMVGQLWCCHKRLKITD